MFLCSCPLCITSVQCAVKSLLFHDIELKAFPALLNKGLRECPCPFYVGSKTFTLHNYDMKQEVCFIINELLH
jgi:hypothetical protein